MEPNKKQESETLKRKIEQNISNGERSRHRKKKKPNTNNEDSSSDESEESLIINDEDSPWEEDFIVDDDLITVIKTPISELKSGTFLLVQFKGEKRKTALFKFVCSIEDIDNDNDEVEVVGLKSIDDTKQNFSVQTNDKSFISEDQITGVLPLPDIK